MHLVYWMSLKGLQKNAHIGLRKAASCSVSGILYLRHSRKFKQDNVWKLLWHVNIEWLDLIKQLHFQFLYHAEFSPLNRYP
ncbi:hypothetical protein A4A49_17733 [Nicotiana attenuata]|uniref:Uncharacterized protein n=1 Tax=Nicotiana attenuata TaxID=49451 RepID=A0A314L660_NICAT|nr:hypothetical protein A4A49_17733 [Nicotiana attenuata]